MKKNFIKILFTGLICLGLYSCTERIVGIDYSNNKKADTSYMAAIEPPQTKNYYIEEFSGVRCTNCPRAVLKLEEMIIANPDRLKIVAIHAKSFSDPSYNNGSIQDLRSVAGADIIDLIYGGDPPKPNASFDRLSISTGTNPLLQSDAYWDVALAKAKELAPSTPINIHLTSTYNKSAEAFDINVKLAYNVDVNDAHALSIYIVEDNIIDKQIKPEIENFKYNHVLRQALTPVNGVPVLESQTMKEAGLVYETNYQLKLDLTDEKLTKQKFWNLDNIHIIAFVHKPTAGADKKVFQAVDAALK